MWEGICLGLIQTLIWIWGTCLNGVSSRQLASWILPDINPASERGYPTCSGLGSLKHVQRLGCPMSPQGDWVHILLQLTVTVWNRREEVEPPIKWVSRWLVGGTKNNIQTYNIDIRFRNRDSYYFDIIGWGWSKGAKRIHNETTTCMIKQHEWKD